MLLHCVGPPLTHCYKFLLFCEGKRKDSDNGGCSDYYYYIIGLTFRHCWGWRFCAFQSHAISNYSSGKQDSVMSSLNMHTSSSKKMLFSLYHSAYLFLVGWNSCWATLYLGGFSPLFIFLISPACICTSGSNSVLCDLYVTFLSSYEISVTGRSVNVWEIEMNLGVAVKKKVTILRAQPLPIWAQCPSFTGLWFPTEVDKAIWVQLFHLYNVWRSQGRSRGKAQKLNPVLLQFLTKIGTRSIWASLEMAVPCWRRGFDA